MQFFQHMDVRCPNTYCIPPHVQLHLCMFASIRGNIQLLFKNVLFAIAILLL